MRSAISEDTYTGDAGRIIALSQGITDEREICLFMDALTEEYNNSKSCSEAKVFLDCMMDFTQNPDGDFIIGTVRSNVADGPELTRIISSEKLPKKFSGADVEIRLKKIEKPPMKDEAVGVVVPVGYGSIDFQRKHTVDYGLHAVPLHTNILSKYNGKKVKITIEELKE